MRTDLVIWREASVPVSASCFGSKRQCNYSRSGSNDSGFVNLRLAMLFLVITSIGGGCCSLCNKGFVPGVPTFSEQEVRSKTWKDTHGQPLQLLEWSPFSFKHHGELLVAKYGDANAQVVTCLEFYRVIHQGQGPVAVVPLSPQPPSEAIIESIPDKQSFDLLMHDYRPERVTSVETVERGDKLLFTITRETIQGEGKQEERRGLRYILVYDRAKTMYRNARLEVWNLTTNRK